MREANEPGFNMEKPTPTINGDSNNICHVIVCKLEIKSVPVADFFEHQWASSCEIKKWQGRAGVTSSSPYGSRLPAATPDRACSTSSRAAQD